MIPQQINYTYDEVYQASLAYFKGDKLAATTWMTKYALKSTKDCEGEIVEVYHELTPDDMHKRLAKEFARIESNYPNPLTEDKIYEYFKEFKYIIPQGSPMAGIGNNESIQSISNCFVIGNEDHPDSYGAIFKIDQELVQLCKRRGGVGTDLSDLRPATAEVTNAAKTSSGVVSFMERYSNSVREVAQLGRRGALMLSISVKHPDAEDFINAKLDTTKITGANVSVKITDEFMRCVRDEAYFTQIFPIDELESEVIDPNLDWKEGMLYKGLKPGTYFRKINAKKLWDKLIYNAWKSGEPGILFWDTMINGSASDVYKETGFETVCTNPCLTGDTKVLMADGSEKCIKDIVPGDKVISVDLSTNREVISTVSWSGKTRENANILEINGLRGTFDHKLADCFGTGYHLLGDSKYIRTNRPYYFDPLSYLKDSAPKGLMELISDTDTLYSTCESLGGTEEVVKQFWISEGGKSRTAFYRQYRYWLMFHDNGLLTKYDEYINHMFSSGYGRKSIARLLDVGYTNLNWYCDIRELKDHTDNSIVSQIRSEYQFEKNKRSQICKNLLREFGVEVKTELPSSGNVNIVLYNSKIYYTKSYAELKVLYKLLTEYGDVQQEVYYDNLLVDFKVGSRYIEVKDSYSLYSPRDERDPFQLPEDIELIDADAIDIELPFTYDDIQSYLVLDFNNIECYNIEKSEIINNNEVEDVYDINLDSVHNFYANGILVHNCGELPLPAYDSCRLMAINLYSFVDNPFTSEAKFNENKFNEVVVVAQRLMDDMIDLELEKIDKILEKIDSDPEDDIIKFTERRLWLNIRDKAKFGRRTGLGVTAEGDMLAALGLVYGSEEGIAMSTNIHMTFALASYASSIMLAKQRGAFPAYDKKLDKSPFLTRILVNCSNDLIKTYEKYGRRNIATMTLAPTGSVSILTQTTSGIEPAFRITYKRRRKTTDPAKAVFTDKTGDMFEEYRVFHHKFIEWFRRYHLTIETPEGLPMISFEYAQKMLESQSDEQIQELIKASPYYQSTAGDINWVSKVEMQGEIQKWIDHSISCTVNVPNETTVEQVDDIYKTAWSSGCKGVTIYREGSRDGVLISEQLPKKDVRPPVLDAKIIRFKNGTENWISFIGLRNGKPWELFTGKVDDDIKYLPKSIEAGKIIKVSNPEDPTLNRYDFQYEITHGYINTLPDISGAFNPEYYNYARFVSAFLQQETKLENIIIVLEKLKCGENINVWNKGVARALKKFIQNGTKSGKYCEHCGAELVYYNGCTTCLGCGQGGKCD